VPKDAVTGAHYYKLAADQGDGHACKNYGRCLRDGIGVAKDVEAAAHYFKLAADQGVA
jgi:TPR repeat protein